LILFIKLGLPPLHIWLIRIARIINKETFAFIITGHKLLPLFLLRKIIISGVSIIVFTIRLVIIGGGLFRRRTLFHTLIFSSMLNSLWICLRVLIRKRYFIIYWTIYRLLLFLLIYFLRFIKVTESSLTQRLFISNNWVLISGIPPFVMFWVKVFALTGLISSLGFTISLILIFTGVLALTSYYRTWHLGRLLESRVVKISSFGFILIFICFWSLF